MTYAIYSRKSKFTGKGESIENQVLICKQHILSHDENASESNIVIYEDEGYSGGNTERPQYQQMFKDAKGRKFNTLVCYRLDRISRNVSDFSALIEELHSYDINFISIREQFDTSTPMGRAMMYIASVFAQLERETIAERIRDNMLELAKTGRWLGGITPLGYNSKPVTVLDQTGKQHKYFILQPVKNDLKIVELLYSKYLELKTLTKLETYCLQNSIKTKNNKEFTRKTLKFLLSNPVYVVADLDLYHYLKDNKYEIYSDEENFDGRHGIMAYNKTLQQKHHSVKIRNNEEWIIAIGKHTGIISSASWIAAQELLQQGKSKSYRRVRSHTALLSGLLRCSNCNSYMRPKASASRSNKDGDPVFYYICERKLKSKGQLCSMKNANGNELDSVVINEVKRISQNDSDFFNKLNSDQNAIQSSIINADEQLKSLQTKLNENGSAIENLVESLAQCKETAARDYLIKKINSLDESNSELKTQIQKIRKFEDENTNDHNYIEIVQELFSSFASSVDTLSTNEKRNLLKAVIDTVIWDGSNVDINLLSKKKCFRYV